MITNKHSWSLGVPRRSMAKMGLPHRSSAKADATPNKSAQTSSFLPGHPPSDHPGSLSLATERLRTPQSNQFFSLRSLRSFAAAKSFPLFVRIGGSTPFPPSSPVQAIFPEFVSIGVHSWLRFWRSFLLCSSRFTQYSSSFLQSKKNFRHLKT